MENKTALYLAWTMSLVATAGSLFFTFGLHWTACDLCWYQRIFQFPLVIILGVGIWKNIRDIELIALPMTFLGMIIAIFHNLLQYKIIPEDLGPCSVSASCTLPYHFYFNWLTIPLGSLIMFVGITICLFIYRRTKV